MAEATIPVTTPIKEEKGMDDLRVVYVKVKGEQEMVNAVMDTGAQMPVHEMGEVKDSNMELNDFRHGVVPVSKNLVNDMLICSSDYEVLIEKLRKAHEIAAETAEATQNNYASYYNLRSREKQFKVGDKVLVLLPSSTHKLMKTWIGPATIIEITRPYSAKVELDDGGIRELHFNKLRPYIARVGQVGLIFDQDSDFGDLHYAPTDMAVSSMGGCYRSHKQ
ncbi:retrovirus-related Pol polyprotein from transposon opus [Trichonephila clavipes]|nr:retrovirus-related Pol polyprotein from transposon opus [Trichonephila clavipes]